MKCKNYVKTLQTNKRCSPIIIKLMRAIMPRYWAPLFFFIFCFLRLCLISPYFFSVELLAEFRMMLPSCLVIYSFCVVLNDFWRIEWKFFTDYLHWRRVVKTKFLVNHNTLRLICVSAVVSVENCPQLPKCSRYKQHKKWQLWMYLVGLYDDFIWSLGGYRKFSPVWIQT